ncbi:hypothetical protein D3C73_1471810 [compost metagenome]
MTGEGSLGVRRQVAGAGHIIVPGLHLAAADDPVAGIETDFGIGRQVAIRLVTVLAVKAVDVIVEQPGDATGLITREVPNLRTHGVRGHDQ